MGCGVVCEWMYDIQLRRNHQAACSSHRAISKIRQALAHVTDASAKTLLEEAVAELNTIDERLMKGPYYE